MLENGTVFSSTVTSKRQITIPTEICDNLNIQIGDKVQFKIKDNTVIFDRYISGLKEQLHIEDQNIRYNLIIPFTSFSDALTMGVTDEIFRKAFQTVKDGGKVIIQKEYSNSPPQIMKIFDTEEEIESWKKRTYDTK